MKRLSGNLWCFLCALLLSAALADGQVIGSFSPGLGSPGDTVFIQGSGFTGVSGVRFWNGENATFNVLNDGQISATVPNGTVTGLIGILKSGNWFYSVGSFGAIGPGPFVVSFSPTSGNSGVQVTFTGAHFSGVTSVRFNGVAASFSVTSDAQLRATVPSGATSGSVTITSLLGSSATTTFTVPTPPTIVSQPASQTLAVGSSVTFTVSASSATAYQWRYNSANISGANSSSFTKSNLQLTDSGSYDVLVSNVAGSVTSSTASLTVAVPPAITSQPQNRTVNPGVSATFSASASGSSLSYQWCRNGGDISGANGSSYTLASPQAADSGSTFSLVVNNAVGSATSSSATLTVNSPPSILSQPSGNTIFTGQNVTFSVSASGSTPFTYQWQKNSANISGATASSYSINNAQATHAGSYRVVVGNSFGSITSAAATLTVNNPVAPSFTTQPQNQTVNIGQTATFSAAATGSPSPSYQWRKNGANISGATASSYTVSNVQLTHAGTYDVVASNLGGNVPSSGATLTVNGPPVVTSQPASQTAVAGATITLSVTASGSSPLTYQWRREGTNLTGATSASLVLNAAQPGDSGYYSVVVTNPNGTTTSTTATINVLPVGAAPNRVLTLDGNGDFVTIPSAADLQDPYSLTFEGWFYPIANAANTNPHFINKGDGQDGASSRSYELRWTPTDGFRADVFLGTNTYATLITPAPAGQWTHIAITYDSERRLICLYKNGVLTTSSTNNIAGVPLTGQPVRQTTLPLVFGVIPGGPPTHATGSMDEVRIWSRVRSSEEIAGSMLCRLAGNEPGLAGYWTFDDGTATDLTGHGHNGVLSGDATTALLLGAEPLHTTNQAPCITSQPQSLTVGIGQNASFAVTVVAGTNPGLFSYQWRKDGTNVIGATGAMLVLTSVGTNQAGSYTVVVSNAAGSVTSAPQAVLTVNAAPAGAVVAWGNNSSGQTTVPAGLSGVTAIAAGEGHTVALKSDSTVVAWGRNGEGQTTVPAGLSGVTAIAAGAYHTVALKSDGAVVAWGAGKTSTGSFPEHGQSIVPAGLSGVTAIAAGDLHTVALKSDGTVVAWGAGTSNTGSFPEYGQSIIPAGLSGVTAIAAGGYHTVALKSDGTVVAWGRNLSGQTNVPAGLSGVTAIAAGGFHTVAIVSRSGVTIPGSFPAPTVPLLWWPGDGDASDFQGTRNGTLVGNVTFAAGKVNEAFEFDGVNGGILRTADVPTSATDNWAMSAWVYWRGRTFAAEHRSQVIIYNGQSAFNGYGVAITEQGDASTYPILAPTLGKLVVLFGGVNWLVTTNTLDANVWNHLVLTRESGVAKLYKDGQFIALPSGFTPNPPSIAGGGAFSVSAPGPQSFYGRIDDVCVFGSALTSNQVQAIYQAGAAGFSRAPEFSQVSIQPGGIIRLSLKGRTGQNLSLQSSTNLLTWEPLDTVINWPGSNTLSYPMPASGGRRFYRALHP